MTHTEQLRLAELRGTLRGTREALKSEIRISGSLKRESSHHISRQVYGYGEKSLVRIMWLLRDAERQLDETIKEVQSD